MSLKLPQARKFLYFYVVAMLALQGWVLVHAWRGVTQGLPDFTIFYTAGQILRERHGAQLYDNNLQATIQQAVTPVGLLKRGSILPYNHPPFEAIIFVPLSRFSYLTAYLIWAGMNCALLVWLALLLRKHIAALRQLPVCFLLLAVFTFDPVFIALLQGQDSILLLFCFTLAYLSLIQKQEFAAGVWIALGLFKFNLVLPFLFPLVLLKRRQFAKGLLVCGASLFVLSLFVVGPQGLLRYPQYVWGTEQDPAYLWNSAHANQSNLRGLFTSLLPHDEWLRTGLLILASGIVLLGTTLVWHRIFPQSPRSTQRAFAIGVLGSVLLSFHLYLHDLSLLLLAMAIIIDCLSLSSDVNRGIRASAYACIALLFCSPIYLLLTLRYKELEWVAVVVLVLFAVLVREALQRNAGSQLGATTAARLSASG